MPAPSLRPLYNTHLFLFREDVEQLKKRYGRGWSEQVRLIVAKNCEDYQAYKRIAMENENE